MLAGIEAEGSESYRHFRTPTELGLLVRDDLAMLLSERFAARAPATAPAPAGPRHRFRARYVVPARCRWAPPRWSGGSRPSARSPALAGRPGVRLVTLTGPGGVGKTRLAVAAGERLRDHFDAGTVFVPLAAVTDPGLVLAAVARAVGADLSGTGSPVDALAERIGDGAWLLISNTSSA